MITPYPAGISALSAFSTSMRVTANNVANATSDGFKKSKTTLVEGPSGAGVRANVTTVNTPGHGKAIQKDGKLQMVETSNVDLTEEITDTLSTKAGYKANLKSLQAHDEMIGALLDTVG